MAKFYLSCRPICDDISRIHKPKPNSCKTFKPTGTSVGDIRRVLVSHWSFPANVIINWLGMLHSTSCYASVRKAKLSLSTPLTHRGERRCITPHIFNLGISWRRVVSFTLRPIYPRKKKLRYPVYMRMGRYMSQSGRFGDEKISYPCQDSNPGPSGLYPSPYNDDALFAS
jgi:hypothetical protein